MSGRELATEPTQAWCGSAEKIAIMAIRASFGLPLFVAGDFLRRVELGAGAAAQNGGRKRRTGRGSARETLARLLTAMTAPRPRRRRGRARCK
jgi:hypothetical protein